MCDMDCMDCRNELNLCKLCAKKAKIEHLCVKDAVIDSECVTHSKIVSLSVVSETVNDICVSGTMSAQNAQAVNLNANNLCAQQGTINTLCVDNLTSGNFIPVVKYRATVNYSASMSYSLGSFVNFNTIVDDPNGNVSLVPFTTYTAPVSGYYNLSFKLNVANLVTPNAILGIPVANPEIYVNGVQVREIFAPFISFFNDQKTILDSLILLQAGDVVSMKFNILAGSGTPIAGSVDIAGGGVGDGISFFKIILASAMGGTTSTCITCPPVSILCQPNSIACGEFVNGCVSPS